MLKHLLLAILCINLILLTSSVHLQRDHEKRASNPAETVYHGGHILSMDSSLKFPKFVAVSQGKIVGVGKNVRQMQSFVGRNTNLVDLHGATLIPGLVDAHSHFGSTTTRLAQGFDISPPPFGKITSISRLLDQLRRYIDENDIQPGVIISGQGYSDIDMEEGLHPNRFELDSVSTVNPIMLSHFSGHIVVANSLALQMVNITDTSEVPIGGVIDRFPNGTITGVCRESAVLPLVGAFSMSFGKLNSTQVQAGVDAYLSCGVTTVHDMLISQADAQAYKNLEDDFPLDVNGYFWISSQDLTTFDFVVANYNTSRYQTRGTKFILDGSIQGYTALLTQPYWVPQIQYLGDHTNQTYDESRNCSTQDCGQDTFPDPEALRNLYKTLLERNVDILSHCNGDAAADNMLTALEWARNNSDVTSTSRVTMIHAQTVRDDQLDKFESLGLIPSFFPAHIQYWGDKHYEVFLGPQRANRINPAGSALRRNLKFTIHTDSPVVPAGVVNKTNTFLKLVSAAVNRVTSSGRLLDDGTQKIPVYVAFEALTINAAWQSHEETTKGSITVGKVADFAILNFNPLNGSSQSLDNLSVLATVKEGKLVFGEYPRRRDL